MADPDNPIRRGVFKQRGGPGSDLLIRLFVGLPLAVGALTLLPPPFGVIAVIVELAVIALLLWEGQRMARLERSSRRSAESRP